MGRDNGSGSSLAMVAIGIVAILALVVIVVVNDHRPRSSEGVVTIDDYTARISRGDTLVLTSSCGKSCSHTWLITWDGEKTVRVDDNGGFFGGSHYTGTLCGIDCPARVDLGWFNSGLDIAERSDRTVEVHWAWTWGYRRYEAPR